MSRRSASRRSRSPMTSSKRRACSSSSRLRAARSCSSFSSGLDAWARTRRARSESEASSAFRSSLSRPRRGMSMPTQFRTSVVPCGGRRAFLSAVDVGTVRRQAASSPDPAALLRSRVERGSRIGAQKPIVEQWTPRAHGSWRPGSAPESGWACASSSSMPETTHACPPAIAVLSKRSATRGWSS